MRKATNLSLLSLLIVTLFCSTVLLRSTEAGEVVQDLSARVEAAESITTLTQSRSTQLVVGGEPAGPPVVTEMDPVVEQAKTAKVLVVEYEGNIDDCFIKVRSDTTKVQTIRKGVYLVDTPGTHLVQVDLLDRTTGNWPDLTISVTVDGDSDVIPTPDPVPDEDDAVIQGKPRVLIVYEATERTRLPRGQLEILTSKPVRDYLDSVCAERNGTPEWRMVDKDTEFTTSGQETFVALMNLPRLSVPWIIISGEVTADPVYQGPLPASVEGLKELVGKYATNSKPSGSTTPVVTPRYEMQYVQVKKCDGLKCWYVWEKQLVRVE